MHSHNYCVLCYAGARTVVHPSARILAEGGPIIIGESNLIQEKAVITNRSDSGNRECKGVDLNNGLFSCRKVDGKEEKTLVIGNSNVFSIASGIL